VNDAFTEVIMSIHNDRTPDGEPETGKLPGKGRNSSDIARAENAGANDRFARETITLVPYTPGAGSDTGNQAHASKGRYAVLAASIAISAALGSVVGAFAGATLLRPVETREVPVMNPGALKETLARISADIATLKGGLDTAGKNTASQLARFSERIDRTEKAQAEPSAKIAKLSEAVERLERKADDGVVTGSIAPKQQARAGVVDGWVLREIYDGRALVENQFAIFEVGPGSQLPGLGRVETIRRQDGRWIVVTAKGIIVSSSRN